MSIDPGTRLGPYDVVAPIGAGGMGEVYRAHDARLDREVAIKVLPASYSADPDRLRRFEQEARAAGRLNHPNVMAIYDIGTHEGAPYVVVELLEGATLREKLATGALPTRKAVDYALQIARGLGAAHEKGIVHRDLKPENVFVTNDGRVKILDFGLAKLTRPETSSPMTEAPTETRGTEPGSVFGTVGYMSPEQIRGQNADARSDIFAFGAVAVRAALGPPGLPRQLVGRRHERDPERGSGPARRNRAQHPAAARAARLALPREERRGALPVRARHRLRPRVAVRDLGLDHQRAARPHRARAAQAARRGGARRRGAGRGRRPPRRTRHEAGSRGPARISCSSPSAADRSARRASRRTDRASSTAPGGMALRPSSS